VDATWRLRFEDLIHEANGQEIPSIVRARELEKVIQSHLVDNLQEQGTLTELDFRELYEQIAAQTFRPSLCPEFIPETVYISEELYWQIVNDPAFYSVEGNPDED